MINDKTISTLDKKDMKTILLVEDSLDLQEIYCTILEDSYNLVCANDPLEALKHIKNRHFDLIITDQSMPNMTGLEFIDLCILKGIKTPFIFSTAHDMIFHSKAKTLRKPFSINLLLSTVSESIVK